MIPINETDDLTKQRIIKARDLIILDMACKICELSDAFNVARDELMYNVEGAIAILNQSTWQGFDYKRVRREVIEEHSYELS